MIDHASMLALTSLIVLVSCGGPVDRRRALESPCEPTLDADWDSLPSEVEGTADLDHDGLANYEDDDSDGDGKLDVDEAGDTRCDTAPTDRDFDEMPDFLDTDANGNWVDDRMERNLDQDSDGLDDDIDFDLDGDGINNRIEAGPGPRPLDTDADGVFDFRDLESDGDGIPDRIETSADVDSDGIPNHRDLDSDGDAGATELVPALMDAREYGLANERNRELPRECAVEARGVDALDIVELDGAPDFLDYDSDNDGLPDFDEERNGLNRCGVDSDHDGDSDLIEGVYSDLQCRTNSSACACGTSPECRVPDDFLVQVLPFETSVNRAFSFVARSASVDLLLVLDATNSMQDMLSRVRELLLENSSLTGGFTSAETDLAVGALLVGDFPFASYGESADHPSRVLGSMRAWTERAVLAESLRNVVASGGGDTPEAHTYSLGRLASASATNFTYRNSSYNSMDASYCASGRTGALCHRVGALPLVLHFTDACSHMAPTGDSVACTAYSEFTPTPPNFDDMATLLRGMGARYLGFNTGVQACAGDFSARGEMPCFFMNTLAQQTQVERGVVDLRADVTSGSFATQVVQRLGTLLRELRFGVRLAARSLVNVTSPVDVARFVESAGPRCFVGDTLASCHNGDAQVRVTHDGFSGVAQQTQLDFGVVLRNQIQREGSQARVFSLELAILSDTVLLGTRTIYVVVPAARVPALQ